MQELKEFSASTINVSAGIWLNIKPETSRHLLLRTQEARPLKAGLLSRFILLSDNTLTIVTVALIISIGRETGVPWKFAPVKVILSSGIKIGLSPTPVQPQFQFVLLRMQMASCAAPDYLRS